MSKTTLSREASRNSCNNITLFLEKRQGAFIGAGALFYYDLYGV